jgi:hypothetical protein
VHAIQQPICIYPCLPAAPAAADYERYSPNTYADADALQAAEEVEAATEHPTAAADTGKLLHAWLARTLLSICLASNDVC